MHAGPWGAAACRGLEAARAGREPPGHSARAGGQELGTQPSSRACPDGQQVAKLRQLHCGCEARIVSCSCPHSSAHVAAGDIALAAQAQQRPRDEDEDHVEHNLHTFGSGGGLCGHAPIGS